jgi:hypothetical protein
MHERETKQKKEERTTDWEELENGILVLLVPNSLLQRKVKKKQLFDNSTYILVCTMRFPLYMVKKFTLDVRHAADNCYCAMSYKRVVLLLLKRTSLSLSHSLLKAIYARSERKNEKSKHVSPPRHPDRISARHLRERSAPMWPPNLPRQQYFCSIKGSLACAYRLCSGH